MRGPSGGADSVRPLRGDHSRFRIRNDLLGDRAAGWPLPTVMAGATAREPRREIVFPPDARIAIPWASENEWLGPRFGWARVRVGGLRGWPRVGGGGVVTRVSPHICLGRGTMFRQSREIRRDCVGEGDGSLLALQT